MNIAIDPVELALFGWYLLAFLGVCIVGGVIHWLLRAPLEFIGALIDEGKLP